MSRFYYTAILILMGATFASAQGSPLDDFIDYTRKYPTWPNGSWGGFRNDSSLDEKADAALRQDLKQTRGKWRITEIREDLILSGAGSTKFTLILVRGEDEGESVYVLMRVLAEWRFKVFDPESINRDTAEPGATDNPDDAQRLREDH